jgi:hypothetical protein
LHDAAPKSTKFQIQHAPEHAPDYLLTHGNDQSD